MTTDQIRTSIELRLRRLGISIVDVNATTIPTIKALPHDEYNRAVERLKSLGQVGVMVSADRVPKGLGIATYALKVNFGQSVELRKTKESISCTTWEADSQGVIGESNLPRLRELLGDLMDKFVNDYLKANPVSSGLQSP